MAKAKHEFVASQEALNGPEITLLVVDHTGKDKQFTSHVRIHAYLCTYTQMHMRD
jgi:hypothetical protein